MHTSFLYFCISFTIHGLSFTYDVPNNPCTWNIHKECQAPLSTPLLTYIYFIISTPYQHVKHLRNICLGFMWFRTWWRPSLSPWSIDSWNVELKKYTEVLVSSTVKLYTNTKAVWCLIWDGAFMLGNPVLGVTCRLIKLCVKWKARFPL